MVLTTSTSRRAVLVARGLLIAGMVAVAWASLLPPGDLPGQMTLVSDKAVHAVGYAALGALAVTAGMRGILALGVLTVFGLLLEVAQRASGYRSFEWADLLADAVGASMGIGSAVILRRSRGGRGGE